MFDGTEVPCQRPSWNYRKTDGGGLILDMYPHWRYVIEGLLGPIRRVVTSLSTATPERIDERGARYAVDVEDSAATSVEMESGATGTILAPGRRGCAATTCSPCRSTAPRARRIAGLHRCWTADQRADAAHRAFQHRDRSQHRLPRATGPRSPSAAPYKNPYRVGWENFLRHVATGAPMQADFAAGIRDVQFAQACYRSMKDGTWISLEPRS